ncbi:MAG: SDR family oxidoreductase [Spirochaetia bacterium]
MNIKKLYTYSGKTALITGGASGIGLEFSRLLAQGGWNLILAARTEAKLEKAREELSQEYRVSVRTIVCDLSAPGAAEDLYRELGTAEDSDKEGIFLLINNAGSGLFGPTVEQEPGKTAKMIHLNITSLTLLSSFFGKEMAARGGGFILNVGSMAGRTPMPFFSSYGASKSYVHNFTIALRAELSRHGVVLSCLEPGYVRTSFDSNASIENERYRRFSHRNGMDPQDVAAVGLRGLFRKKARIVPGISNKIAAAIAETVPPSWAAGTVYKAIGKLTS